MVYNSNVIYASRWSLAHPNIAIRIARRHQPLIIQSIKSGFDFISSLKYADKDEFKIESQPEIYYQVRNSPLYYYLIYAFYHRYDPAARHQHDFEGVLFRIDKKYLTLKPYKHGVQYAAVNHMNLEFGTIFDRPTIEIEADGHGLSLNDDRLIPEPMFEPAMIYNSFKLVSMGTNSFFSLQVKLRKKFDPWVNFPDNWFDRNLENYVKRRHPIICGKKLWTTRGLFDYRADLLLALAEWRKRI